MLDETPIPKPQQIADNLRNRTRSLFALCRGEYQIMFDEFWRSDGATPQEIADALGADAPELLRLSRLLLEMLNAAKPGSMVVELPGELSVDANGRLIVTMPEAKS
jgi:hypothetical protein